MKQGPYCIAAIVLTVVSFVFVAPSSGQPAGARSRAAVSAATQECIDCHIQFTPGIVADWRTSRHSRTTPGQALLVSAASRRMSAAAVPEMLEKTAVGCYECHSLRPSEHKDNFEHFGSRINVVVSPQDCRTCHPDEADQYSSSKKAHAVGNLAKNPVYSALVNTIDGMVEIKGAEVIAHAASDATKAQTCFACHGTEVKVAGTRTVSAEIGDIQVPDLEGWPNQGVGRINPDGSLGACTSCHPRHSFSIEVARKPYTCQQCHLAPDVPAWNIYKESKHGNIFLSLGSKWDWDDVPWKVGEDFTAPTCAVCHNSLITGPDNEVIAARTHDFGERLWVRLFGLIYAHPQPLKGDTSIIRNADGLPLPTTFTGSPASTFLIDNEEQKRRRNGMAKLCGSCHSTGWTQGHFDRLDAAVAETNKMTLAATQMIQGAWDAGLADPANPFDQHLEYKWIKQWLFYANSIRYAAAMGGPDYAAFKNGWWNLSTNLGELKAGIDAARAGAQAAKGAMKNEGGKAKKGSGSK